MYFSFCAFTAADPSTHLLLSPPFCSNMFQNIKVEPHFMNGHWNQREAHFPLFQTAIPHAVALDKCRPSQNVCEVAGFWSCLHRAEAIELLLVFVFGANFQHVQLWSCDWENHPGICVNPSQHQQTHICVWMSNRFTPAVQDSLFIWSRVTQERRMVLTPVRVTGLMSGGSLRLNHWYWYWSFTVREHLTQTWRQTNGNHREKISFVPSPLSYKTHGNLLPNFVWWPVDVKGASVSRVLCFGTAGRTGAESIFCLWCVVFPGPLSWLWTTSVSVWWVGPSGPSAPISCNTRLGQAAFQQQSHSARQESSDIQLWNQKAKQMMYLLYIA